MNAKPVVIVTGADSGIGLAIARKFAEIEYRVVLSGIASKAGKKNAQAIQKLGGVAIYVKADVRRETDLQNLIRQTIHQWGRLDVLCNNAGIQRIASVDKTSSALWDEVMTVNARGPFLAVKVALPYLRKTRGCIVNIASTAGLVGYAAGTVYSASKAALVMMSKVWALELAAQQIRVNCICPGATRTAMIKPGSSRSFQNRFPLGESPNRKISRNSLCSSRLQRPSKLPAVFLSSMAESLREDLVSLEALRSRPQVGLPFQETARSATACP